MSDTTAAIKSEEWKPSRNPWYSAAAVMITIFMVVLDSSIANVALPNIAGSFSATQDESTWVLTSYLVANGVIIPSTAWFSTLFGRKKFLLLSTILFTVASAFCGMATSMGMLIVARVIQGLGGGAIMPISQAVMMESFPPEERGVAMSVFGFGIIFAPIIGPTLGGWITDTYSWHWIFLINVPIGIIAVILGKIFVEDPPYARKGKVQTVDYIGFILLIVWLFSLQLVLDNGNKNDWFGARWIRWTSGLSVACFIGFIVRELKTKNPIVDLKVFLDRNFTIGTILNTVIGAVLYSTLAILPLFLQHLLGYTATLSGLAISPRGFGSLTGLVVCAILANKVDQRYVVAAGMILLAVSNLMFGSLNMEIAMNNIIFPNVVCGFSFSLLMIPLMTISFVTLKNSQMTNGSGIFNLAKSVGGAIGTSVVSTMIARMAQVHQTYLVKNLSYSNPAFSEKLQAMTSAFGAQFGQAVGEAKANFLIYGQLQQQANLLAFMDCFKIYAAMLFLLVPTVFIFKKVKYKKSKKQETDAVSQGV